MPRILTHEDVSSDASPPNAPTSTNAAESAFGWSRRRRSCGGTEGKPAGRRGAKTDRKDARGIAQLMRFGCFRPVHCNLLRPALPEAAFEP